MSFFLFFKSSAARDVEALGRWPGFAFFGIEEFLRIAFLAQFAFEPVIANTGFLGFCHNVRVLCGL